LSNIKFNYLYRDGANYKSWGEVVFANPENLSLDEVNKTLASALLSGELFIANQISIPEKFFFLNGKFTQYDHCYHEFDCLEVSEESPTDSLGRLIIVFLNEVKSAAKKGWKAFDILERA
jgi:hypothetical protein